MVAHKKQSQQEKEDEEEKLNRERSKRMMNYGFTTFGVFMGIGFTYLVYELGRPNYDEHGNPIEDEFSHLPFFEQIYKRIKRELNYYTRVTIFLIIFIFDLFSHILHCFIISVIYHFINSLYF